MSRWYDRGKRWWMGAGRPTYPGRRRPRLHVGRCSHDTAWQVRFDGFGRYAFIVRRDR